VAWVPTVPAARITEGASGMETDLSHPQFAQAVPLRQSLADALARFIHEGAGSGFGIDEITLKRIIAG
jgi:hypothetical protein